MSGPGRISTHESNNMSLPNIPAFRVLAIDDNIENCGLRSVNARRSRHRHRHLGCSGPRAELRHDAPKSVNVTLNFANVPQGSAPARSAARAKEREATFTVHTRAAGILEARLYPKDAFGADNYAALELPELRSLHVIVYSNQPGRRAPRAFVRSARRRPSSDPPRNTRRSRERRRLVILHNFRPPVTPQGNVLWIDPPVDRSARPDQAARRTCRRVCGGLPISL